MSHRSLYCCMKQQETSYVRNNFVIVVILLFYIYINISLSTVIQYYVWHESSVKHCTHASKWFVIYVIIMSRQEPSYAILFTWTATSYTYGLTWNVTLHINHYMNHVRTYIMEWKVIFFSYMFRYIPPFVTIMTLNDSLPIALVPYTCFTRTVPYFTLKKWHEISIVTIPYKNHSLLFCHSICLVTVSN